MGNHYHLVIETSQPGFSDGLQWLNGLYAARFNRVHGRVGHLFGGRFGAVAIESDEQLAVTCEYVIPEPRPRRPLQERRRLAVVAVAEPNG